jgi:hypothetical protein
MQTIIAKKYALLSPIVRTHHRVHRVATAAFWRTFHREGKISPGWSEWGVHAGRPPPFITFTITSKFAVYSFAPAKWALTLWYAQSTELGRF